MLSSSYGAGQLVALSLMGILPLEYDREKEQHESKKPICKEVIVMMNT